MSATDLVVLGDSVMWGQGLLPQHKSATLVAKGLDAKVPGIQPVFIAHSGAVIGRAAHCATTTFPGEVPESCPSILQQIAEYPGDPSSVRYVMVNGGINDIDIRTILNPFTLFSDLASDIRQYCFEDMKFLLVQVKAKFSHPDTRIVVSSYFPILTSASDLALLGPMVEFMGAPLPTFISPVPLGGIRTMAVGDPIVDKILALCVQFWHQSNQALSDAVAAINIGTGPRCFFAQVPFTENNAVFAPQAWLFGIGPALDFAPLDEVADTRAPECELVFQNDFIAREQCFRASAGHPNPTGAQHFAQAILGQIG